MLIRACVAMLGVLVVTASATAIRSESTSSMVDELDNLRVVLDELPVVCNLMCRDICPGENTHEIIESVDSLRNASAADGEVCGDHDGSCEVHPCNPTFAAVQNAVRTVQSLTREAALAAVPEFTELRLSESGDILHLLGCDDQVIANVLVGGLRKVDA